MPAYEALQDNGATAERMMGALLRGVSTRQYAEVLPEMAGTVGVSRSSISRRRSRPVPSSCAKCRSAAGTKPNSWCSTLMASVSERTM